VQYARLGAEEPEHGGPLQVAFPFLASAASRSVLALPGSTADEAQGSGLASLGSLARHAESARALFPASSPEGTLRRVSESQKPAVNSAQTVDCLLALVWDYQPTGCHVIPAGLEWPKALERSDSAGPLSTRLAFPPEHFRPATVSVQVKPLASVFRQVPSTNG